MKKPKQFVRLLVNAPAKHEAEFRATLRELKPNAIYRVKFTETTDGQSFYYLDGGYSPHSAYLFETV